MYAALIAMSIGTVTRLVWAKAIMGKKLYRVPIFWVVGTVGVTLAVAPKASVFMVGIFLVDIISFTIRGSEKNKETYRGYLNWTLDKLPIKENVNDEKL